MTRHLKITFFVLLMAGTVFGVSAVTFLIETRVSQPRNMMEPPERIRVVSAETGIMDTLFDQGHIFFNTYTSVRDIPAGVSDESILDEAADEGAAYLLILKPDSKGITWQLFHVPGRRYIAEDYADLETIDPDLDPDERWMALGVTLAREMLGSVR